VRGYLPGQKEYEDSRIVLFEVLGNLDHHGLDEIPICTPFHEHEHTRRHPMNMSTQDKLAATSKNCRSNKQTDVSNPRKARRYRATSPVTCDCVTRSLAQQRQEHMA
jgi:hypothetical protein